MNKQEAVNHPAHYNKPGQRECIVAMEEDYGPVVTGIFCLTNAYKYLYRAGDKPGADYREDTEKAKWYVKYAEGLNERSRYMMTDLYIDVRKMLEKIENE